MGCREPEVIIRDTVPAYASGLAAMLERAGASVRLADSLDTASAGSGDVIVTTVRDQGALDELAALIDEASDLRVVALLEPYGPEYYVEALVAGAVAALPIDGSEANICDVTLKAAAGWTLMPQDVVRWLRPQLTECAGRHNLSSEDLDRIRALAQGKTVVELAEEASYSERAMHRLLRQVYDTLGVESRQEAIALAAQWGLLTGGEDGAAQSASRS